MCGLAWEGKQGCKSGGESETVPSTKKVFIYALFFSNCHPVICIYKINVIIPDFI